MTTNNALLVLKEISSDPEFLRSVRKQAGITLVELGALTGVDHTTISRWENGRSELLAKKATEQACIKYLDFIARLHEAQSKLFRFAQAVSAVGDYPTAEKVSDDRIQEIKKGLVDLYQAVDVDRPDPAEGIEKC